LRYRFNDIELDTASMELRANGALISLEPQVFDLLQYLIENRERVVSRDDLIASVWNGRIVSETTISARINAARRAVGDGGNNQSVIKTVPRRGYRFIADVRRLPAPQQSTKLYKGIEIPADDEDRVAALKSYAILDTDPEKEYDDLTKLAALITGCEFSYISFCDETRFWLKSTHGYPNNFRERPRELSMCPPTILQTDLFIIEDMRKHVRYKDLPSVKNPPHTCFYCAMPLINPEGYALGTICVWDPDRITLDDHQQACIRTLARQVMALLEMRRRIIDQKQRLGELLELVSRMKSLLQS
jgi:DNA-binding winged helix-turn-helix (wHTH) protein